MKFLIIGDLHGKKPNIYFKDFDAIVAPGDFCSSNKIDKLVWIGMRKGFEEKSEINKWFDLIGKNEAKKLVKESIAKGRRILEFLNSFNAPVYIVPGNWDWTGKENEEKEWDFLRKGHFNKLVRGLENLINAHEKITDIGDYQIIGYGISSKPEYPQYKEDLECLKPNELRKRKEKYTRTLNKLARLFEKTSKPVIFLSHNVPFNTPIDKITSKDSPRYGYHYGSLIVRELIERYQPLVSIGGHMHEHFGKCKIGKTVCINAGFGPYVNTLLELEGDKIKSLKFYRARR